MTWDTRAHHLDAGRVRIALAGLADPAAHMVQVRLWQRKRQRERLLATATLWVLGCLLVSGAAWWLGR